MSVAWNTLPAEIWMLIFDQVDDVEQLAKCRLVCRAWNPLAEEAMFSQFLHFTDVNTLTQFYNHLTNKAHLGRCIRGMNFANIDMDTLPFLREFLQLAFTPNIQSVQGTVSDESLKIILDIAQNSTKKFEKLGLLTLPYGSDKPIHYEITLFFRKTLKNLCSTIGKSNNPELQQSIIDRLDQFESLTFLVLHFYQELDSLAYLDGILDRCHHLGVICIAVGAFRDNAWVEQKDLNEWMVQNVNQCINASKQMSLIGMTAIPQLVEYALYKYPNVPVVALHAGLVFSLPEKHSETIDRCMNAVKNVKRVRASGWKMPDQGLLQHFIDAMKSKANDLKIHETEYSLGVDCIALVEAERRKLLEHTTFRIRLHKDHSVSLIDTILSSIGVDSFTSY